MLKNSFRANSNFTRGRNFKTNTFVSSNLVNASRLSHPISTGSHAIQKAGLKTMVGAKTKNSVSGEEAMKLMKSNSNVFVHSASAAPQHLLKQMCEHSQNINNVEIFSLHVDGEAPYLQEKYRGKFHASAMFLGANERKAYAEKRGDYIPVFLSQIPSLFRRNIIPLEVALVQISPPDKHGYCSMGISVDCSLAAVQNAKYIIAQVNKNFPRTHGDGWIHISQIDAVVEHDEPVAQHEPTIPTPEEDAIGGHIAPLISDRACLQLGVGAIPNAVLSRLENHKDLGVHTEMFSDGLIPLIEKGVVTNRYKKVHPENVLTTFMMGSERLYDFVDDNPFVIFRDVAVTNDTARIRKNPNTVAINSAIEVDLTGQICADSIGTRMFSGVGGQMDFIHGAALSEGGLPIIAITSTTKKGQSKIVPTLKEGAGVVTTRAHVHYVVTEYGVVDLFGKNLRQRAKALIDISHPDHREELAAAAEKRFGPLNGD
eukprot:gb/GECH01012991.1/.p1 GENE.gb/GECH01012991.1/~~gb/GECH01012991.1/.p1  ORF type:complete len:485 (+),score=99.52 gb/GECH01012991.1/:1-1455(+)